MNTGEELVSSYLKYIRGCEFTQQNLYTDDVQGEIDVVGIDYKNQKVYICEVAIHLVTGLRYTNPNNVVKLTEKLSRNIQYAKRRFHEYETHIMLWSPIVKASHAGTMHCQTRDIESIRSNIVAQHNIEVEFITNEKFQSCICEMRNFARLQTKEIKCPILRFMQIEEYLARHLGENSLKTQLAHVEYQYKQCIEENDMLKAGLKTISRLQ